jgi:hypothetical protein
MGMQASKYLIAGYPMEGTANDIIGERNGVWVGVDEDYTNGVFGQSSIFSTINFRYIDLGSSGFEMFDGMKDFSVTTWVMPFQKDPRVDFMPFNFSQNLYVAFSFCPDLPVYQDKIIFWMFDGNHQTIACDYEIYKWLHLVGNFIAAENKMELYVNAVKIGEKVIDNPNYIYGSGNVIGCHNSGVQKKFNGLIDNIKIYNKALTVQEVKRDYLNLPIF